jgi:hypothetical protein
MQDSTEQLLLQARVCRQLAWTVKDPATSLSLHAIAASCERLLYVERDRRDAEARRMAALRRQRRCSARNRQSALRRPLLS